MSGVGLDNTPTGCLKFVGEEYRHACLHISLMCQQPLPECPGQGYVFHLKYPLMYKFKYQCTCCKAKYQKSSLALLSTSALDRERRCVCTVPLSHLGSVRVHIKFPSPKYFPQIDQETMNEHWLAQMMMPIYIVYKGQKMCQHVNVCSIPFLHSFCSGNLTWPQLRE